MGVGFIWPVLMITGIIFLPESPRWDYRNGNIERARQSVAKAYGVSINHWEVDREMREIKEKYDAEFAGGGKHVWYEIFTGPRMAYRTLLGVTLQALQQLTGMSISPVWARSLLMRGRRQLLLLLRHDHLRVHRSQQQLRHLHYFGRRQLRHDFLLRESDVAKAWKLTLELSPLRKWSSQTGDPNFEEMKFSTPLLGRG